ncbi:sensor histidine kinase [Oryzifoliimicrobium ureilyticus]|uniref:sensor histidine kinase n=1 Tax=Oryzifoliimicrobium ureilyticus TaxID=3113724 RepID=UPI0030767B29
MIVLSSVKKQASGLIDKAAAAWLSRIGGEDAARHRELAILRRLAAISSVGLLAAPIGLSFVTSPAVALPAGVAAVAAAFLFSAVGSIALSRHGSVTTPMTSDSLPGDLPMSLLPDIILIMDPQGSVLSAGGRDLSKYLTWMQSPTDKGFFEQLHVHDRVIFLQSLDRLRQGEARVDVELRVERAGLIAENGRFAWLRLDMTARSDSNGELSDVIVQARDISAEKQLRLDVERHVREAASANEAKSRFLAAVSHELRTPLNAVLGFSDVLLGEYFGRFENERQREYVGLIKESGGHLLSVVNTMLDMCKIEAGRYELTMEPFEAAEPIRACEGMLGFQAKTKGLVLTSRLQKGLGEIVADRRAIQQILINLVGNAVKFTEAGGVITIDASLRDGIFLLSVSDTGIGIAEAQLEKLGQPFTQVEDSYTRHYEGTGLGLCLVKGLVNLHGGHFAISSREQQGTIVSISLPADGSGALTVDDKSGGVEFPPRLKAATPALTGLPEEGLRDGVAQAKIA